MKVPPGNAGVRKSVDTTTRKPILLLRLSGLLLLRAEQRAFLELLLNAPPRNTRGCFESAPAKPNDGFIAGLLP